MRVQFNGLLVRCNHNAEKGYVNLHILPDDSTNVVEGYVKSANDPQIAGELLGLPAHAAVAWTGDLFLNQGRDGQPARLNFRPSSIEALDTVGA